ncbi:MAG: hypothetical protein LBC18_02705 [Opitutaceae bacterium]|jgi:hypothetical protein|nr:hypothetical protein [Opitutaceae bacterium]
MNKILTLLGPLVFPCALAAQEPPVRWETPSSFDPAIAGLGLPQLPGVTREILYAPLVSKSPREDGGSGRYESPRHGTYNHHTQAVIYNDKIIVYWTNHARDENGPGQRLLARWGTISAGRNDIDWGSPEASLVEIVPPPSPVLRREPLEEVKDRRYVEGHLQVVDGRLRVTGPISIYHGWTNDLKFRTPLEPVPEVNFRELRDNARGFRHDMRWDTGSRYYQEWTFADGKLAPASPLYLDKAPVSELQLTARQKLRLGPLLEPYRNAPLLSSLPPAQRDFFTRRAQPAVTADGKPRAGYDKDTRHLAANGRHGLAHMASFRRPDGTYVIIRDNLADPQYYFAAEAPPGGRYPPAIKTNLYGCAMPAAGELPDGTAWILGNSNERFDFYITTSRGGRVFDRTWAVCHDAAYWERGLFKPSRGGPQYPYPLQIGNAIWVFHSIGKERIAVVRIPYVSLYETAEPVARDDYAAWRGSHPESLDASASSLRIHTDRDRRGAWLPFSPVRLARERTRVRLRLQFTAARTFGAKDNALIIGLFNQGSQDARGYSASLAPVSDSGIASVSLHKQGAGVPGGALVLASGRDFHRKLAKRLKYDVEFAIEKTDAGALVSIRIFGGDMPRAVEVRAPDGDAPLDAFNTAGLVTAGAGMPDITISNFEISIGHTPSDAEIPGGSAADELKSAAGTAAIHQMMSQ